jgi:hypothetical protein
LNASVPGRRTRVDVLGVLKSKAVIAGLPLVNDTYFTTPAWSPDGTKIAYAGMDDDEGWGNIWTITPDGKNNTRRTVRGVGDQ